MKLRIGTRAKLQTWMIYLYMHMKGSTNRAHSTETFQHGMSPKLRPWQEVRLTPHPISPSLQYRFYVLIFFPCLLLIHLFFFPLSLFLLLLSAAFKKCTRCNQDLSKWIVSKVTNMEESRCCAIHHPTFTFIFFPQPLLCLAPFAAPPLILI